MACSRCNQKNKGVVNSDTGQKGMNLQELYDSGQFVFAKYLGPSQVHNIGSPTGVIVQFNMGIYGRGKNGDIFLVHKDDANSKFGKFLTLEGGVAITAAKLLNIVTNGTAKVAAAPAVIATSANAEKEAIIELVQNTDTDVAKLTEALNELIVVANDNGTNDAPLKRSEALVIKEFVTRFGFTHQLQVMTKVRSGELKSYKNEDGKTMVYHVED